MATFPVFFSSSSFLFEPDWDPAAVLPAPQRTGCFVWPTLAGGEADELRPLVDVDLLFLGESNSSATSPTFTWFSAATPG